MTLRSIQLLGCLLALCLLTAGVRPAAAQNADESVPRNDEAESVFEQALQAFTDGDYGMAFRRFRLVTDRYPLNRKTTAAWLMAGKALYRNGDYERAAATLDAFIEDYATSRYVATAARTRDLALEHVNNSVPAPLQVGILLSLNGQDAALTQMLFNGIRLAVDEHNAAGGRPPPIRMVFRDTRNDERRAAAQVTALAEEGVQVIFGPLYSGEARAAAAAAERAGVVLVAPLATDERVSAGRRFVFQANPTITMRGRQMARFAVRSLRIHSFGIVAEADDERVGERMAEGFMEEVTREGGDVRFYKVLENEEGWYRLPDVLDADTLSTAEALYLPITTGNAASLVGAALSGLDRLDVGVRVLGNSAWDRLPQALQASLYNTAYTQDFYMDAGKPAVQDFQRRYRALARDDPDRLAFTGYDVMQYLIGRMTAQPGRALVDLLREGAPYEGLGLRIDFSEGNVNQAMYYQRYRDGRVELLR